MSLRNIITLKLWYTMITITSVLIALTCLTTTSMNFATDDTPQPITATPELLEQWKKSCATFKPTTADRLKIATDNSEIDCNIPCMLNNLPKNTWLLEADDGSFATVTPMPVTLGRLNYSDTIISCSNDYPDSFAHVEYLLLPRDKALTNKLRCFNAHLPKAPIASTENRIRLMCCKNASKEHVALAQQRLPHSVPLSFLPHITQTMVVTLETVTFPKKNRVYFFTAMLQLQLDEAGRKRLAQLGIKTPPDLKAEAKTTTHNQPKVDA